MSEVRDAVSFARTFTVRDGRIVDPGKFEGEAPYVPYFHWHIMEGSGEPVEDEEGNPEEDLLKMYVEPEDVTLFPTLKGVECVVLWYREDGFVQEVEWSGSR